ncbi:hypothetical protein HDU81_000437 [Chytriomyces hyalinus]|nr:hypothetical protein HDU81_000437 [Chytriomyces hyalinus]
MRLVWLSICILASALSGTLAQSSTTALTSAKTEPTSPASRQQRKGHYNYKIVNMKDIIKAGASCDAALRITGTPTCEQLIDMTGMDWNSFIKINKFLNCLEPLKKGMLVCVPPAASVGELPAHIPIPATKSQARGTATATAIATSPATKTTSDTVSLSVEVTTTEAPPSPSPDPPPVEEVAPPAPEQPASSPGGVDAGSCIAEFARARSIYNGGNVNPYLSWSGRLSDLAQQSADYAAGYNCCDASCHTLSGGGSGIAQVLFCGQFSCSSAYNGWVTDEAPYQGGHWSIIVGYPVDYPYVGCAVSLLGGGAIVCNFSWGP